MAPSISIREYIRWLPDEAKEPTTTLVLTSAERRFVDIRIRKPSRNLTADEETDVLHTKRLDWAFAGTSSSEIKKLPDGSNIVHSRWQHWVDSRTEQAETVADEGDMFPQTDGTTLETGRMVNPATGLPTDYEERWRDVEPISTERSGGGAEEGRKVCVVLQLHDDVNRARGMVVRVGQFCQGLLRVRDGLSLERWEWESEKGWRRMAKMGDMWLPCGVLLEGEKLRLGGEVKYGEFAWKVVEMSDF